MPEGIEKSDWDTVHQMAVDVANASIIEDDSLLASRNLAMLTLLSTLNKKYGDHPSILATIGDYLDDPKERRDKYLEALSIAEEQGNQTEIDEIEESLIELKKENSQQ